MKLTFNCFCYTVTIYTRSQCPKENTSLPRVPRQRSQALQKNAELDRIDLDDFLPSLRCEGQCGRQFAEGDLKSSTPQCGEPDGIAPRAIA